jgi:hypothetical protein
MLNLAPGQAVGARTNMQTLVESAQTAWQELPRRVSGNSGLTEDEKSCCRGAFYAPTHHLSLSRRVCDYPRASRAKLKGSKATSSDGAH